MTSGYAALEIGQELQPHSFELPPVARHEVRIQVDYCGLCASDVDAIEGGFSRTPFPLVPGHEVVGRVYEVGADVSHLSVGDRVGVGPQRDACLRCEQCGRGHTHLCPDRIFTIGAGFPGGMADQIQLPAAFAFRLPATLDPAAAAPLLCAGVTVYSPLRDHMHRPGTVGVIGVGGLGHLAIRFARALGHRIVTFVKSPGAADIEQHRALGAHGVVDIEDKDAMKSARGSIDLMLSLIYGEIEWRPTLNALAPRGTLCLIGNTESAMGSIVKHLVHGERRVVGSASGSRATTEEMLRFAAEHGIDAQVEMFRPDQVNSAIERMRRGSLRYRAVVDFGRSTAAAHD